MMNVRPALETDLESIYDVYNQAKDRHDPHHPSNGDIPAYLYHVLQTGTFLVAEQDGVMLAFTGAITRGRISFLTDLFVHPSHQSGHIGKMLLHMALPEDGLIHCTASSSDHRALAIYIRAGMTPQWPYFALQLEQPRSVFQISPELEICEAEPDDEDFMCADAACSGLARPQEHVFWVREERAVPLWFRRQGQPIGYGYIRLGAGTQGHPQACTVGPIGVICVEEATSCVLAAVWWAVQHTDVICIGVPGPHPCLPLLLERGFRITDVETFVSTAASPFFDAHCYIPSGGDLF